MRQHVNPLSNYYDQIIPIPPTREIFKNPDLPLHLDLGSANGDFLFKLALQNQHWNYIGIEIRERLVTNAKLKLKDTNISNLFFAYGNAINLIKNLINGVSSIKFDSISVYFPDPWFKKKHHKRRIIQDEFIYDLSKIMTNGSFIFVKSDVLELFQYIELTILNSSSFLKVEKSIELKNSFNPKELRTDRENYVVDKRLPIFEQIYVRK